MPDIVTLAIITLALIATASFLGATIAIGYLYGSHLLLDWWENRKTPATTAEDAPTDTGVYDWKTDEGVTWRR